MVSNNIHEKYLKYKSKYIELSDLLWGGAFTQLLASSDSKNDDFPAKVNGGKLNVNNETKSSLYEGRDLVPNSNESEYIDSGIIPVFPVKPDTDTLEARLARTREQICYDVVNNYVLPPLTNNSLNKCIDKANASYTSVPCPNDTFYLNNKCVCFRKNGYKKMIQTYFNPPVPQEADAGPYDRYQIIWEAIKDAESVPDLLAALEKENVCTTKINKNADGTIAANKTLLIFLDRLSINTSTNTPDEKPKLQLGFYELHNLKTYINNRMNAITQMQRTAAQTMKENLAENPQYDFKKLTLDDFNKPTIPIQSFEGGITQEMWNKEQVVLPGMYNMSRKIISILRRSHIRANYKLLREIAVEQMTEALNKIKTTKTVGFDKPAANSVLYKNWFSLASNRILNDDMSNDTDLYDPRAPTSISAKESGTGGLLEVAINNAEQAELNSQDIGIEKAFMWREVLLRLINKIYYLCSVGDEPVKDGIYTNSPPTVPWKKKQYFKYFGQNGQLYELREIDRETREYLEDTNPIKISPTDFKRSYQLKTFKEDGTIDDDDSKEPKASDNIEVKGGGKKKISSRSSDKSDVSVRYLYDNGQYGGSNKKKKADRGDDTFVAQGSQAIQNLKLVGLDPNIQLAITSAQAVIDKSSPTIKEAALAKAKSALIVSNCEKIATEIQSIQAYTGIKTDATAAATEAKTALGKIDTIINEATSLNLSAKSKLEDAAAKGLSLEQVKPITDEVVRLATEAEQKTILLKTEIDNIKEQEDTVKQKKKDADKEKPLRETAQKTVDDAKTKVAELSSIATSAKTLADTTIAELLKTKGEIVNLKGKATEANGALASLLEIPEVTEARAKIDETIAAVTGAEQLFTSLETSINAAIKYIGEQIVIITTETDKVSKAGNDAKDYSLTILQVQTVAESIGTAAENARIAANNSMAVVQHACDKVINEGTMSTTIASMIGTLALSQAACRLEDTAEGEQMKLASIAFKSIGTKLSEATAKLEAAKAASVAEAAKRAAAGPGAGAAVVPTGPTVSGVSGGVESKTGTVTLTDEDRKKMAKMLAGQSCVKEFIRLRPFLNMVDERATALQMSLKGTERYNANKPRQFQIRTSMCTTDFCVDFTRVFNPPTCTAANLHSPMFIGNDKVQAPDTDDSMAAWVNTVNQSFTKFNVEPTVEKNKSGVNGVIFNDMDKFIDAAVAARAKDPSVDGSGFLDVANLKTTQWAKDAVKKIGEEFANQISPMMEVFFTDSLGKTDGDKKNVLIMFYGASGSGKTKSAQTLTDWLFDRVKKPDQASEEYLLSVMSDYNNSIYDYYSDNANVVYKKQDSLGWIQQFLDGSGDLNNPNDPKATGVAAYLKLQNGWAALKAEPTAVWKDGFAEGNDAMSVEGLPDENTGTLKTLKGGLLANVTCAKDNNGQEMLLNAANSDAMKIELYRRIALFRGVSDTGLNAASSRSHLVYMVRRKGKTGPGSFFALVDLAGTEDLNFLFQNEPMPNYADPKLSDITQIQPIAKTPWYYLETTDDKNPFPADVIKKCKNSKGIYNWGMIPSLTYYKGKDIRAAGQFWSIPGARDALIAGWCDVKFKCIKANLQFAWMDEQKKAGKEILQSDLSNMDTEFSNKAFVEMQAILKDQKVVSNRVFMMHQETRHIDASLNAIRSILAVQKKTVPDGVNKILTDEKAIKTYAPGPGDQVYNERYPLPFMTQYKKNTEVSMKVKLVTEILYPILSQKTSVVLIAALNPRRADDYNSYVTMKNVAKELVDTCPTSNTPCSDICTNKKSVDVPYKGIGYPPNSQYVPSDKADLAAAVAAGFDCTPPVVTGDPNKPAMPCKSTP